jgi:hypothetical protein
LGNLPNARQVIPHVCHGVVRHPERVGVGAVAALWRSEERRGDARAGFRSSRHAHGLLGRLRGDHGRGQLRAQSVILGQQAMQARHGLAL